MSALTCFWFLFVCYLVCIKCAIVFDDTSIVNPIGSIDGDSRKNWTLFRQSLDSKAPQTHHWIRSIQRSMDKEVFKQLENTGDDGILVSSTDACSRYCIDRYNKNGVNKQYINVFWTDNINMLDQPRSKDHSQLLLKTELTDTRNSNNIKKNCQIYLDLNCNITETGTASNYVDRVFQPNVENSERNKSDRSMVVDPVGIKIAEKYNLNGQTQINFLVNSTIHRIIVDIDGNVSNALLQIPMDATVSRDVTAISWTHKGGPNGVRIDTRNAPPGEWRMRLVGVEDSKYRFVVQGIVDGENDVDKLFSPDLRSNGNINNEANRHDRSNIKNEADMSRDEKETFNDKIMPINSDITVAEQQNLDATSSYKLVGNRKITQERSLKYVTQDRDENEQIRKGISTEYDLSIITPSTESMLLNLYEYVTIVDTNKNLTVTSNSSNEKFVERMIPIEEWDKSHKKSSIGVIDNLDVDIRTPIQKNVDTSMRMIETRDNHELSEELANYANENIIEEKTMLIEVNRNSNLLVTPGTIHRIVFDVMNSCILPVRYVFRVKSTPFRLYNIQPAYTWIYPGQMSNVAVDLIVPDNVAPDTANTVTLFILGTEIKEKSVYLYVKGSLSKLTDDVKPTTEYSFNNNCAGKLVKDQCYKSRWSVDITIQDYDSGLKRVISSLNNVYPRTEFISGTRSPVTFYYSATCCDKTVKITAIDLLDNYSTITIDVTAWNNLSEAEIAAITVGALMALLFIIAITVLIIYCIRKRKSHDLPYTQRYGSRPPTQSERTTF
ncbi:uncharacterized protein LOC132910400 [Bombus pascuorum]|uniref:uncharacterized protein LOC132910400 n=1 Tax=Bombus pascuorum TaxID=65598 RepID=UPI00298E9998|nr:uncharacterized protein LOC132910400 [Bombus pascuorum]